MEAINNKNNYFTNLIYKWVVKDYNDNYTSTELCHNTQQLWNTFITKTESLIWKSNKKPNVFNKKVKVILKLLNHIEENLIYIKNSNSLDKKALKQYLNLLKKAETKICTSTNYTYYTLPYLAQFIYISMQIFDLCLDNNILSETIPEVAIFLYKMEIYMKNVIETSFKNRKSYIRLNQTKDSNIVYLYDNYTQQYLTYNVPLQQEVAQELTALQHMLQDKISEDYMNELPIDTIQNILNMVSKTQNFKPWKYYISSLVPNNTITHAYKNNKIAKINKNILCSLTRDNIRNKYLADIKFNLVTLPITENVLVLNGIDWKPIAKGALSAAVSKIISLGASATVVGVLSAASLGCLAPLALILFDKLFSSTQPVITKEEMIAEIDKRVHKALTDYQITILKAKFSAAVDAYLLRMVTIKNHNMDIKDQSKWDLGKPEHWEAAINTLNDLKAYFFINDYDFQYQTSTLFITFATMYLVLLYGRLQTVTKESDTSVEKTMLQDFFTGWYTYIQKATAQVCEHSYLCEDISYKKIKVFWWDSWMIFHTYDWINEIRLADDGKNVSPGMDMVLLGANIARGRLPMLGFISSNLYSLIKLYNSNVSQFNTIYNQKLPLIDNSIFNYAQTYVSTMNHAVSAMDKAYPDKSYLYYGIDLPGLSDIKGPNFKIKDCYVRVGEEFYCTGDYIFINEMDFTKIVVPRFFKILLFKNADYTGESLLLPDNNNVSTFNYSIKDSYKSMQVRLDFYHWYISITKDYFNYGRVKGVNSDGKKFADNISVVLPTDN